MRFLSGVRAWSIRRFDPPVNAPGRYVSITGSRPTKHGKLTLAVDKGRVVTVEKN